MQHDPRLFPKEPITYSPLRGFAIVVVGLAIVGFFIWLL